MTTTSPEGRQQSDVRRDQMLVAAAELIAERGFERTRIADVAKRIETSPALVMYYFATKDELLTAALRHSEASFYKAAEELLQKPGTIDKRLASADAMLEPWISFAGTPLEYTSGANLNGIAATADGRYLIVVQMAAGRLFRIDTRSREVARIDVGAEDVTLGDGLVLAGQRLYLVRQGAGEVVTLDLGADFLTAKVVKRTTPRALAWPATAALVGNRLIIANSQLNKRASNTPAKPFGIDKHRFDTQLPGPDRGDVAARSPTHDQQLRFDCLRHKSVHEDQCGVFDHALHPFDEARGIMAVGDAVIEG